MTQVVYTTITSDVVVYVDPAGIPWSTTTVTSVVVGETGTPVARSTTLTPAALSSLTPFPVQPSPTSVPGPFKDAQPSLPPSSTQTRAHQRRANSAARRNERREQYGRARDGRRLFGTIRSQSVQLCANARQERGERQRATEAESNT